MKEYLENRIIDLAIIRDSQQFYSEEYTVYTQIINELEKALEYLNSLENDKAKLL